MKKLLPRPAKLTGFEIVFIKAVVATLVELSVAIGVGAIGLTGNDTTPVEPTAISPNALKTIADPAVVADLEIME